MKALSIAAITVSLVMSSHAYAGVNQQTLSGLLNSKKPAESTATTSALMDLQGTDIMGLVTSVSENLGVTEAQSQGGIASVFNYVKGNLSSGDFSSLSDSLPGLDSLMGMVPETTTAGSTSGKSSSLSGLLNKASEYSGSMKSINDLKNQFEALGLTPEMISSFVSQISTYLQSEEGQQTQSLFRSGLDKLVSNL